jgi:hypothetical protein
VPLIQTSAPAGELNPDGHRQSDCEVVRQVLRQALTEAGNHPQHLDDVFTDIEKDVGKAGDQVKRLKEIPQKLKGPPFDPPDWFTLLFFLLVKIKELIGDDRLSIGYRQPAGWSRMLTLNFSNVPARQTVDPAGTQLDDTMAASLGVAVTDPDVTHGISLQIIKPFDVKFQSSSLTIAISAGAAADWQYVFGAPMKAPTMAPGQTAHCTVDLSWHPWGDDANQGSDAFEFRLGPLHLKLVLSTESTEPLYTVTVGLGTDTAPGVHAAMHPEKALGPALGSLVHIGVPDESYTPQLTVVAGGSPRFTLGHNGNG